MTKAISFADSLTDPGSFTITFELVPGQGAGGKRIDRLLEFAGKAKEDGRIKALSITDNAGGHPALAPMAMGSEIQKIGLEPLIHFSLKDKNRNQIESHIFLYERQQFKYLLVLGGDFPKSSYYGQAKPVYDLDTIQTLELVRHIKSGCYRNLGNAPLQTKPFSLECGCVVSPFKMSEAEQVWQYAKLLKKIRAGATFIITQLGFDLKKYEELIHFLHLQQITIPVLANVFIPSPTVARLMARGGVPGILLPTELAAQMNSETKKERLLRAAKMTAVIRGLGYTGIHLGGNGLDFDDISYVLDQEEHFRTNWQTIREETDSPMHNIWFLYEGIAKRQRQLHPGTRPGTRSIHQLFHWLFFSKKQPLSKLFAGICTFCDRYPTTRSLFTLWERMIKEMLFGCRMCGDCTLSASTYLCPQSGCPKQLVNGPCGGSRKEACEVYPDRRCFFVRVYCRLDRSTSIETLAAQPTLPPKDWGLEKSSSWINYFQGRDHAGRSGEET